MAEIPDPTTSSGLNKAERLAREAAESEEVVPELNRPWPFGGVAFPASAFDAQRSDIPDES